MTSRRASRPSGTTPRKHAWIHRRGRRFFSPLPGDEEVVEEQQQERDGRSLFLRRQGQQEEAEREHEPGPGPALERAGGEAQAGESEESDESARAAGDVGDGLGRHRCRGEEAGPEQSRSLRVGALQPARHPEEERSEERGVAGVDEDVDEVIVPWRLAAERVVEGPGEVQDRTRRLVRQDRPKRPEVADRRVADDQVPVVVQEAAGDRGRVHEERHRGGDEGRSTQPPRVGAAGASAALRTFSDDAGLGGGWRSRFGLRVLTGGLRDRPHPQARRSAGSPTAARRLSSARLPASPRTRAPSPKQPPPR